jgi:hypothetical protein
MPGETGVTVVTTLVCFLFCTRGCGRIGRPAFPAPSDVQWVEVHWQNSGESRRENANLYLDNLRHCEERKRRSNPFFLVALWIASLALAMTAELTRHILAVITRHRVSPVASPMTGSSG